MPHKTIALSTGLNNPQESQTQDSQEPRPKNRFSDKAEKRVKAIIVAAAATGASELLYGVYFDLSKVYSQSSAAGQHGKKSHTKPTDQNKHVRPESHKDEEGGKGKHIFVNMSFRILQRSTTLILIDTLPPLFGTHTIGKLGNTAMATIAATLFIAPFDLLKTFSAVQTSHGKKTQLLATAKRLVSPHATGALMGTLPSLVGRNTGTFLQAFIAAEMVKDLDNAILQYTMRLAIGAIVIGSHPMIKLDATKTLTNQPVNDHLNGTGPFIGLNPLQIASHIHKQASHQAKSQILASIQSSSPIHQAFMKAFPHRAPGWPARVVGISGGVLITLLLSDKLKTIVPERPIESGITKLSTAIKPFQA